MSHASRPLSFTLLAILCAAALVSARTQTTAPAPARQAAPLTVTLAHFNDVYEIDAVEGGKSGGLARVATVIAGLRSRGPVIATLGGDYLSPSAIGTARVEGAALAGRQMVDVLNASGLQWATFGNHEFDLSEEQFRARLAQGTFKIVSSNVTDANRQPFPGTLTSAVVPVTRGGRTVRVGLIGLTLDSNKKPWVRYGDPLDAAREAIAALRGKTDALVALTHLSLAQDIALVDALPEIDLVLGGHEHENWMLRRGAHFTPIVKADANVRSLAVVTLTFPASGRPVVTPRLELIDEGIKADPRVQAVVTRWTNAAFAAFRNEGFAPEQVIATVTDPLDGRESTVRTRPGALTDIITAAMVREAKSEIAILNGGSVRIDDVVTPGPLREYDLIRILPFGGKVLRATIEGSLLTTILDVGVKNAGSGGFLQWSGVSNAGGVWQIQGQPVNPDRKYVVALPDFLMTGGEVGLGFIQRTNPQITDVQEFRDIRMAVRDELKTRYR